MGLEGRPQDLRPTRSSLTDMLTARAALTPQKIAFTMLHDGEDMAESLTYAGLLAAAQAVAAKLTSSCAAGTHVLLLYPPGFGHIVGLFGCLLAGMTPVSGLPPQPPRSGRDGSRHRRKLERVLTVIRAAEVGAVVGEAALLHGFRAALAGHEDMAAISWIPDGAPSAGADIAFAAAPGSPSAGDLALLQFTSGSTGEARGVMVTHGQLLHNLQAQEAAFELTPDDVCVSWLPFSHDMGLIFSALAMLYVGGRTILMAPAHFAERPVRWLRAISRYGGTVSAAPNFAYDLCVRRIAPEDREGLDLRRWRFALNGAEPVAIATIDRFCEAYASAGFRPLAIRPGYGLAEATLAVSIRRAADPLTTLPCRRGPLAMGAVVLGEDGDACAQLTSCGRIVPGLEAAIVGECGSRLADGSIGEIWVRGPSVAAGYHRRPQETEAVFGARLDTGDGPYLRTGDLGFLWNGELYVTGRLKDLMIFRGINYYPQDIEAEAGLQSAAIAPNGAVAFSLSHDGEEQLVVLAEVARASAADMATIALAIRRAVFAAFGLDARTVGLVPFGSLPKTPSGKIQRRLTRDLFQADQLGVVYTDIRPSAGRAPADRRPAHPGPGTAASREAIASWLAAWADPWGLSDARRAVAADMADLGLNSLHVAHLTADIQQGFEIPLTIAELFEQRTLAGVADLVWTKLQAPTGARRPPAPAYGGARSSLVDQRLRRLASRRVVADGLNNP